MSAVAAACPDVPGDTGQLDLHVCPPAQLLRQLLALGTVARLDLLTQALEVAEQRGRMLERRAILSHPVTRGRS